MTAAAAAECAHKILFKYISWYKSKRARNWSSRKAVLETIVKIGLSTRDGNRLFTIVETRSEHVIYLLYAQTAHDSYTCGADSKIGYQLDGKW